MSFTPSIPYVIPCVSFTYLYRVTQRTHNMSRFFGRATQFFFAGTFRLLRIILCDLLTMWWFNQGIQLYSVTVTQIYCVYLVSNLWVPCVSKYHIWYSRYTQAIHNVYTSYIWDPTKIEFDGLEGAVLIFLVDPGNCGHENWTTLPVTVFLFVISFFLLPFLTNRILFYLRKYKIGSTLSEK